MNSPSATPGSRRSHPMLSLVVARVREFVREPEAIFWVYVFPLFLTIALGVAFRNRPVEGFRVAVEEGSQAERIEAALDADPRFRVTVCDEKEARRRLRTGRVDLVIRDSGDSPQRYEYAFDPTRTESVLTHSAADDRLQRTAGRRDVVATEDRLVDEPGGRYIDFLVPGLMGMGLMGGGLWGVGFAIVDLRIRKLLKRYLATPMKRSHFMASVIVSRILFSVPEVVLLLLFAWLIFGVTSLGGYASIGLLILLGSLEFAGIGLLVASRARTMETVSGLLNAAMLPMWIGSGIFFSNERFPDAVQPLLNFPPLTPLIHSMRSIMLEGTSIFSLGADLTIIIAWGCVTFLLGLRWFRWT